MNPLLTLEAKKTVAESKSLGDSHTQLFDNPLKREFLTIDCLVNIFQKEIKNGKKKYGEAWIRKKMASGDLPYIAYGRDGVLFYYPHIKKALLNGCLAPREVHYDSNHKKKIRNPIRSKSQGEGYCSIQDLRSQQVR